MRAIWNFSDAIVHPTKAVAITPTTIMLNLALNTMSFLPKLFVERTHCTVANPNFENMSLSIMQLFYDNVML